MIKSVLIGEAHNLDLLSCLPRFMVDGNDLMEGIKYLGGLQVALRFHSSVDARDFLVDESRWKEWFRWLSRGDQFELRFERIAWLKIVGLPVRYWDNKNLSRIVKHRGKIITPMEDMFIRTDLSMIKIGIITSYRRWINEEVNAVANGKTIRIGVFEFADEWSPFGTSSSHEVEDSSEVSGDNDVDDEGISETDMNDGVKEVEDGEICPEAMNDEDNDMEDGEICPDNLKSTSPVALGCKSRGGSDDQRADSIPSAHEYGETTTQGHDADAQTVDLPPRDSSCLEPQPTLLEPGEINANIKTTKFPITGGTPNTGVGKYGL
ncbi:unnamed protein product [Lactuca virosa]|uniref:DUF4283 domain-containing protein n=1 Tax=Lactuca virosa TaxID=75947 RepID=A0AAU9M2W7_9ASTR|nr:unnamed protein product [Lactuca virosa]